MLTRLARRIARLARKPTRYERILHQQVHGVRSRKRVRRMPEPEAAPDGKCPCGRLANVRVRTDRDMDLCHRCWGVQMFERTGQPFPVYIGSPAGTPEHLERHVWHRGEE
jgi:hypothetical protein